MKIIKLTADSKFFSEIVQLGTRNSKTLGHFPEGAFKEHANKGYINAAIEKNKLLGYVLFSITQKKRSVRIVHLCISETARNQGIAKALLDDLKEKHITLLRGIILSCREDYEQPNQLWKKYGFKALDRVRSRSKKENYLIKWWYDFGHEDLFSYLSDVSKKIKVLLDANIIIKLREESKSSQTGVVSSLMADWLVTDVDYYYAPEIFNEILRDKEKDRASETRKFLCNFYEAKFKPDRRDEFFRSFTNLIPGKGENDTSDKIQLAEFAAAELDYFITTDQGILDKSEKLSDECNINILSPTDFILMIDQLNNGSDYLATRLAGVNFDYKTIEAKELDSIVNSFLDKAKNEKKHELKNKLTPVAIKPPNSRFKIVTDRKGNKLGFWAGSYKDMTLTIVAIRTSKSKLSTTLFKQMIIDAIEYCIDKKGKFIKITDENIKDENHISLKEIGFLKEKEFWIKTAIRGVIDSAEFLIKNPYLDNDLNLKTIRDKFSLNDNRESKEYLKNQIERILWPIKFSDLNLPVYIIPIKPYWASQLFDYYAANATLFGSSAKHSWNRENVYYRSVKPVTEIAPARILWYASKEGGTSIGRDKCIVGTSYLDAVSIGTAKEMYGKYKHFGIYEWSDIYSLANENSENLIKALLFSDTEVFEDVIPLRKVHRVMEKHEMKKNSFASPVKISHEIFIEIYKLGKNMTK